LQFKATVSFIRFLGASLEQFGILFWWNRELSAAQTTTWIFHFALTAGELEPLFDTLSNNSAKAPGIPLFNSPLKKNHRDP
jgi:hypothetical protein